MNASLKPLQLSPYEQARAFEIAMSLETAAGVDQVANIGNVTLVACRAEEVAENPLHTLSPTQFEVLKRVAQGCKNSQIADELGTSKGTVKNYLSGFHHADEAKKVDGIFQKLGVNNRGQAAAYIPIDERKLRSVCFKEVHVKKNGKAKVVDKFGHKKQQILEALINGDGIKQIARDMDIDTNGVQQHVSKMSRELGLSGMTELMRVAAGMKNLERYADQISRTLEVVMPAIRETLPAIEPEDDPRKLAYKAALALFDKKGIRKHIRSTAMRGVVLEAILQESSLFIRQKPKD